MSTGSLAIPFPATLGIATDGFIEQADSPQPPSESGKLVKPMNELNQAAETPADNRDDLQQIKGIGQAIEQALNSFHIYCYLDLVDFTPDSLADLLKAKIPSISPHRIKNDDWLGQAQVLAASQQKSESPQPEADDAPVPSAKSQGKNVDKVPHKNWRELADFFVSFGYAVDSEGKERLQTKVHHSQADKLVRWEGVALDQLVNWMLTQANLPLPTAKETSVEADRQLKTTSSRPVTEEAFLELSNLWVSEVKTPVPTGGQQQSALLRAESHLNLSGQAAIRLTNNQLPYIIELFLVDTKTNQSKLVTSDSGQLAPGKLDYKIQQDFDIPSVGRYQFFIIARLLPPGTAATHLQGPIIRVEACSQ